MSIMTQPEGIVNPLSKINLQGFALFMSRVKTVREWPAGLDLLSSSFLLADE